MTNQAIPVTTRSTRVFREGGGNPTTLLYSSGPSIIYLAPFPDPSSRSGIPLNKGASTIWQAGLPLYASTASGAATLVLSENPYSIDDPAALAQAILDGGLAVAIADAINISLPTNIATAINIAVPVSIATAIANTPPTAQHVIQFTKVSYTPAAVGENYGSFSAFYIDGIQHHYPETLFVDPSAGDFRVLKSLFSMRNNGAAIARVSYSMRRQAGAVPDGLFLALNTVRCNPGEVCNFEIEYLREADAATIGGDDLFEPLFSIFTDSTNIECDLSFVCGGFGSTVAPPTPNPPTPHPLTTWVQRSSRITFNGSLSPAPAQSVVFPAPVAIGDVIIMAIAFGAGDIDHVSGCGSSAWTVIKSRDAGYTAAIAWTRATVAGTTATVNFTTGVTTGEGAAVAWQLNGISGAITTGTMPNKVVSTFMQTPPLDTTDINQVYVGVTSHVAGGSPVGYSEIPPPFTDSYDADGPGNFNWIQAAFKISTSAATTSRTTQWGGGADNISVAAVFT